MLRLEKCWFQWLRTTFTLKINGFSFLFVLHFSKFHYHFVVSYQEFADMLANTLGNRSILLVTATQSKLLGQDLIVTASNL